MITPLDLLTEREKATLRLLLAGHDAKSIARVTSLSVHTINERLRDARRKLGVSSSREAARLLAQAERQSPQMLADKALGVAAGGSDAAVLAPSGRGTSLAWLGGGMLIMSLLIATALFLVPPGAADQPQAVPAPAASPAYQAAAEKAARDWMALTDARRWDESWAAAGTLFRTQIDKTGWAGSVRPVREPLGAVTARKLQNARRTTALPGAPDGDYAMLQFKTTFAHRSDAIETVILAKEGAAMRVVGYFIR